MINIGDDVTVSGKVVDIRGCISTALYEIETENGSCFWIDEEDIKTHRPNTKEGE